jgi:hypothetical protein
MASMDIETNAQDQTFYGKALVCRTPAKACIGGFHACTQGALQLSRLPKDPFLCERM